MFSRRDSVSGNAELRTVVTLLAALVLWTALASAKTAVHPDNWHQQILEDKSDDWAMAQLTGEARSGVRPGTFYTTRYGKRSPPPRSGSVEAASLSLPKMDPHDTCWPIQGQWQGHVKNRQPLVSEEQSRVEGIGNAKSRTKCCAMT